MKRFLSVILFVSALANANDRSFHIVCEHSKNPKSSPSYRLSQTVTLKNNRPTVTSFKLSVTSEGKVTSYDILEELQPSVTLIGPQASNGKRNNGSFAYAQPLAVEYSIGYLVIRADYLISQHQGSRIDIQLPSSFSGASELNTDEPLLDYKCSLIR